MSAEVNMTTLEQLAAHQQAEAAMRQTLPQLDTLMQPGKEIDQATILMTDAVNAQARLDSGEVLTGKEAHALMHTVMRNGIALEDLQEKLNVDGFRYGNIAFAVVHRVLDGKHDFKRTFEVLPDEVK
jgi:hypothetical protein